MSDNTGQVKPSWTSFEDMKGYAKNAASNSVQLELSQEEMFNEYFATFVPSELVVDCINLSNAFINYTHDKSLLEETKRITEVLKTKWESMKNTEEIVVDENLEEETTLDKSDVTTVAIEGNDQLALFSSEADDELAKNITALKKKMKQVSLEYDSELSLEENQENFDNAKKDADNAKKSNKLIEDLKGKMDELYLEYDETLTYEENKSNYDKAIDKSENPSYKFPFKIYFKGCDVRQCDHIFEVDHQYTIKEICELMFRHGFKEFAGEVKLKYEEEENIFVPDFTSQRHG